MALADVPDLLPSFADFFARAYLSLSLVNAFSASSPVKGRIKLF